MAEQALERAETVEKVVEMVAQVAQAAQVVMVAQVAMGSEVSELAGEVNVAVNREVNVAVYLCLCTNAEHSSGLYTEHTDPKATL